MGDKELDIIGSFVHKNIQFDNQKYLGKKHVIVRFSGVTPESAKIAKNIKYQIVIKNSQVSEIEFPSYQNIFVFKHFNSIKNTFYYQNDPEQLQSKRFYNYYVPVLPDIDNFYNYYLLRSESGDEFITIRGRKL